MSTGRHNRHRRDERDPDHGPWAGEEGLPASGAAALKERLARRIGRPLHDIRIHDTAQAGELASRLGARAFTVGRDIYVRPELLRPPTPDPEGIALLAHEVVHALQQSGAAHLAMPLLRPSAPPAPVPTAPASGSPPAPHAHAALPVQRAVSGSLPAAEAPAETAETRLRTEAETRRPDMPPPVDPEAVAARVYDLMVRDLVLDRERSLHVW